MISWQHCVETNSHQWLQAKVGPLIIKVPRHGTPLSIIKLTLNDPARRFEMCTFKYISFLCYITCHQTEVQWKTSKWKKFSGNPLMKSFSFDHRTSSNQMFLWNGFQTICIEFSSDSIHYFHECVTWIPLSLHWKTQFTTEKSHMEYSISAGPILCIRPFLAVMDSTSLSWTLFHAPLQFLNLNHFLNQYSMTS